MLLGHGNGTFQAAVNYAAGTILDLWRLGTSTGTARPTWPWPTCGDNVSVLLGMGPGLDYNHNACGHAESFHVGQAVTLTATVSPSAATGKVTFYDGTTVLGVGTLAGGTATLSTILLPAGSRSLRAYYGGDAIYLASTSASVAQTVNAQPANSFLAAVNYGAGIGLARWRSGTSTGTARPTWPWPTTPATM